MTAYITRQLDAAFTRQQGCPMSQAPHKPLFWHALFVTVCLFLVYCVLVYSVSRVQERHESAQHKTAAFHSHEKAQGKAHSLLFSFRSEAFGRCCRSGVARNRIELWFCSGDTK